MEHETISLGRGAPLATTAANREKLELVKHGWSDLLLQALQRGFYGNVAIELAVQDGTIQHVRRRMEQIER